MSTIPARSRSAPTIDRAAAPGRAEWSRPRGQHGEVVLQRDGVLHVAAGARHGLLDEPARRARAPARSRRPVGIELDAEPLTRRVTSLIEAPRGPIRIGPRG